MNRGLKSRHLALLNGKKAGYLRVNNMSTFQPPIPQEIAIAENTALTLDIYVQSVHQSVKKTREPYMSFSRFQMHTLEHIYPA